MKSYIKKVVILILTISVMFSSINILAIKSFAEEINLANQTSDEIIQENDKTEENEKDETESEESETEETKTEETKTEETETEETETEETETEETETEETETEETETEETETEETETSETETEETETEEIETEETEAEETETEETETEETKTEKIETEESETENAESDEIDSILGEFGNEIRLAESSIMVASFTLARATGDFTYYYSNDPTVVNSCTAAEINNIIANSTSDMVIEMNNHVELPETMKFTNAHKYTLDLNNNQLSIVSGYSAITVENGANFSIKNGTITGAKTEKNGGAIYCKLSTLNVDNVTISNNSANYGGAVYVIASTAEIKNSKITDNIVKYSGAGIYGNYTRIRDPETRKYVYYGSTINISNTVISNNDSKNEKRDTPTVYLTGTVFNANNIKVINNGLNSNVRTAGIWLHTPNNSYVKAELNLKNSLVAGNYASGVNSYNSASGITVEAGSLYLENTVVRNNSGYNVGGITLKSDVNNFNMVNSAVYNNSAINTYDFEQYAHDFYIVQSNTTEKINIQAADNMVSDEDDKTFIGYAWDHYYGKSEATYEKVKNSITLETNNSYSSIYHIYNAVDGKERVVATIGDQEFTTIQSAINSAKNNDIIKLIIGDKDNLGSMINEAVTVDEDKNFTIDFNGKKWSSGNANLNALTINGNSNIKIIGEGTISNIDYQNGNLEIDSSAVINKITLGSGKTIKAGENFNITESMELELHADDIEKLKTRDITLIESTNDLSSDLLEKIVLSNENPLVVIKLNENKNIIAHTLVGIFLDGESGDDSNDGSTTQTAVKTFEKAKQLLNEKSEAIFVIGTVNVDGSEEWSLPDGVSLMRYAEFADSLVNVEGTLTLKNITIDGNSDKIAASGALINVNENGTLNISDGAKLTNNNNTKGKIQYYVSGGAVYSAGKVHMTGGEISENTSLYGAGIELRGNTASMILDGGVIKNNSTKNVSGTFSGGAGIAVMNGANLVMNDGEISNNKSMDSRGIGAGILVGDIAFIDGIEGATFTMNGGTISENKAFLDGGGIFVQLLCTGTINAGKIIDNSCGITNIIMGSDGAYGGGGIYVNGGRAGFEDGKLYIANAYISNNTAKQKNGAGIAGCGTSTVYIYPEAATIYNNNGTSELYVDSTQSSGYGTRAVIDISKIAMGEGNNKWTDPDGNEVEVEILKNLESGKRLILTNTNAEGLDTEGNLASVIITGNSSATLGGGIGTNGYLQIGNGESISENIKVTKKWEDNNNMYELRPDNITVNLLANGVQIETVQITAENNWEYTFENLEKYDENENKIEYTITENEVAEYDSKIEEYTITNTCKKQAEIENNDEDLTNDNKNQDNKNDVIDTSDNIFISFITLISVAVIFIIINNKKKLGKHSK